MDVNTVSAKFTARLDLPAAVLYKFNLVNQIYLTFDFYFIITNKIH